MLLLLITLGVAGFVFFVVRYFQLLSGYRSMSTVERRYAEVTADVESKQVKNQTLAGRRAKILYSYGLKDSLLPVVAVAGFGYLAVVATLGVTGIGPLWAAIVAIPVCALLVLVVRRVAANRRKDKFNEQIVTLLEMMASQMSTGSGLENALARIAPNLQDPMQTEIDDALRKAGSGGDLYLALCDIRTRYPSRALEMLLATIEINQSGEGMRIVPALNQAAEVMKNAFALQSEGKAELGSAKFEFYGVLFVVMGLSFQMLFNSPNAAETWLNPLGIAALLLAIGNAGFGVWRFNRIIGRLKKETE